MKLIGQLELNFKYVRAILLKLKCNDWFPIGNVLKFKFELLAINF